MRTCARVCSMSQRASSEAADCAGLLVETNHVVSSEN